MPRLPCSEWARSGASRPVIDPRNLTELVSVQHAEPVGDVDELVGDTWGSDDELDGFLVELAEPRQPVLTEAQAGSA